MKIFESFPKFSKFSKIFEFFYFWGKILENFENFPKKQKLFQKNLKNFQIFFREKFLVSNFFLKIIFTYVDPKFPQDSKNRT